MQKKALKMIIGWFFIWIVAIVPMATYADTNQDPGLYLRILGDNELLSNVTGEKSITTSTPVYGSFYLELAQDKSVATISKVTLYENNVPIRTFMPQVYTRNWDDKGYYKKWICSVLVKPPFGKKVEYSFKIEDGSAFESNHIIVNMPELKTQTLALGDKDDFKVVDTSSKYYNKAFVVVDNNKKPVTNYQLVATETGLAVKVGDSIKPTCIHTFSYLPTSEWSINEALKSHSACSPNNYAVIVSTADGYQGFDTYYSNNTTFSANTLSNFREALGVANATAEMQAVYLGTPTVEGKKVRVFIGSYASYGSPDSCGCPYRCDYSPVVAEIKELSDMLSSMTKNNTSKLKVGTGFLDIYDKYDETILSTTGKIINENSEAHILAAQGRGKTIGGMFIKIVDEKELFNKLGITTDAQLKNIIMADSNRLKNILTQYGTKWSEGFIIDYINLNLNSYIPDIEVPEYDGECHCSIILADFVQKLIPMNEGNLTSNNLETYLVQSILNKINKGSTPFEKALAKLELIKLLKEYGGSLDASKLQELVEKLNEQNIKDTVNIGESGLQGVKNILTKLGIEGIETKTLTEIENQLAHEHTLIGEETNTYNKTLNLVNQVLIAEGKKIEDYQNKLIETTVNVNEKDKDNPSGKSFTVVLKVENETIEYLPHENQDSYETLFGWFGESGKSNGNGQVKQMLKSYHFTQQGNVLKRNITPGQAKYDPRACVGDAICAHPAQSDNVTLYGIPIKVDSGQKLIQECVCRYMQLRDEDKKPIQIKVIETTNNTKSISSNFIAPESLSNLQFIMSYSKQPLLGDEKDDLMGNIQILYRDATQGMPSILLENNASAIIYIRDKNKDILSNPRKYTKPIQSNANGLGITLDNLNLSPNQDYLIDIYFKIVFGATYSYKDYLEYIGNLDIADTDQAGKPIVGIEINPVSEPETKKSLTYKLNYVEMNKIK